eukprot:scaffold122797_cov21-Phaeocystis_antarctica.AAC.1
MRGARGVAHALLRQREPSELFDECVGTLAARQRHEAIAAGASVEEAAEGRDLVGVAAYRSS